MADPSVDSQLDALFSRLAALQESNNFKKALRVVDEVLKISPGDKDALHCKVVALVELSRFDDAIDVISSNDSDEDLAFEKAYCLFRLGNFLEALSALQKAEDGWPIPRLHLEAQLYYRMGRNGDAIRIYHELFEEHKISALELRTNVLAAYVSGGRAHEVPAVMDAMKISSKDSFEIAFNYACSMVAVNDLEQAYKALEHAQRLGRETLLDEEYTEQEVEAELAPVNVQLAYTLAGLGQTAEAAASYEEMLEAGVEDEPAMAVATNNITALQVALEGESASRRVCADLLRRVEALFDRNREVHLKGSLEKRLSQAQKEVLCSNYALLLLLAGRSDAARDVSASLMERYPDAEAVQLVRAAALARDGKQEEAVAVLAGSKHPACALLRAQLALEAGSEQQALEALELAGDADLLRRPAFLASHVALLEAVGEVNKAREAVDGAIAAQESRPSGKSKQEKKAQSAAQAFLYQTLSRLQLKAGDVQSAVKSYERAVKLAGKDAPGVYKLMGELARRSAALPGVALDQLEGSLPSIDSLPSHKVDELEDAAAGSWVARRRAAEEASRKAGEEGQVRQKKKRKRPMRYPKGFDPQNPGPLPNPERWLPKWQRSDFKKKRNRRKDKEAVKGSQGAGRVDEALDRSNVVADADEAPEKSQRAAPSQRNRKRGRR